MVHIKLSEEYINGAEYHFLVWPILTSLIIIDISERATYKGKSIASMSRNLNLTFAKVWKVAKRSMHLILNWSSSENFNLYCLGTKNVMVWKKCAILFLLHPTKIIEWWLLFSHFLVRVNTPLKIFVIITPSFQSTFLDAYTLLIYYIPTSLTSLKELKQE